MRIACLLFLFVSALISPLYAADAPSAGNAADVVAQQFREIIELRQNSAPEPGPEAAPNAPVASYLNFNADMPAPDSALLKKMLVDSTVAPDVREAYRTAVISQLRSTAPDFRGLACELLAGVFDVRALPVLGGLLGDSEGCIAHYRMVPQSVSGIEDKMVRTPVSETSRAAIASITGIVFQSKSAFDRWWQANSRYEDRLWYWSAKWRYESRHTTVDEKFGWVNRGTKPDTALLSADVATLSRKSKEFALKVLLLHRNQAALRAELVSFPTAEQINAEDAHGEFPWPGDTGPDDETVAAFVTEAKLKTRLLSLLQQKDLYPEVKSESAFFDLVGTIANVGRSVFKPEDERAIATAQVVKEPFAAIVDRLILMRATAAPDRAEAILAQGLRDDSKLASVARRLVELSGSAQAPLLLGSFRDMSGYERVDFAQGVLSAALSGTRLDRTFIADLAEALTSPPVYDGRRMDSDPADALAELARAANRSTGTEIISKENIDALRRYVAKANPEDYPPEMKDHNAAIPVVFAQVKAELLAALR